MVIMLQADARRAIVAEFRNWARENVPGGTPNGRDGLRFYAHLQAHRGELLNFRYPGGDRWQIVHSWLLSERLLSD